MQLVRFFAAFFSNSPLWGSALAADGWVRGVHATLDTSISRRWPDNISVPIARKGGPTFLRSLIILVGHESILRCIPCRHPPQRATTPDRGFPIGISLAPIPFIPCAPVPQRHAARLFSCGQFRNAKAPR